MERAGSAATSSLSSSLTGRGLSGEEEPLLAEYERHLSATRALSNATVRNYVTDLLPFAEYLDSQGISLGVGARALEKFVLRNGAAGVSREYRGLVRDYVAWLLERRTVASGRAAGRRGHSRASVHRMLASLRSFIRYLVERELLPDAPIWRPGSTLMGRLTPKPTQRLPDLLSAQEAARLVESPTDLGEDEERLRDAALLEVLYGCGLRVSEASNLDRDNVSMDERTVRVWGKGSKERQTPLGARAHAALRAYLNAEPEHSGPLFLNARGNRLSARSIQRIVHAYAQLAGLRDDVHPHTLRHSYATHLLDGGADLRVVQELLGHSTPSATQVYTHVSQSEARRVYMSAHPLANGSDALNDQPESNTES